tara:strand:- start:1668 stop:2330 length:663 start_codon:yes stop_codon:yes gene_type:complete
MMMKSEIKKVEILDLELMEYSECLNEMYKIRDQRKIGKGKDTLILVEHYPVATLGRRGEMNEIIDDKLAVYEIERGGKSTYHAPGQIVLYPVMHMGEGNRDVRGWVRHLEGFVIDLLGDFGIKTSVKPDLPGVWVDKSDKKIASIGISIEGWVSFHGISINVTIDPNEFNRINPCGLGAEVMTNMFQEGSDCSIKDIKKWIKLNVNKIHPSRAVPAPNRL